jgi:hypothetical protein
MNERVFAYDYPCSEMVKRRGIMLFYLVLVFDLSSENRLFCPYYDVRLFLVLPVIDEITETPSCGHTFKEESCKMYNSHGFYKRRCNFTVFEIEYPVE